MFPRFSNSQLLTFVESYRLGSSALTVIILAHYLQPKPFILFTLSVTLGNLIAIITNLGITFWINVEPTFKNVNRARHAIHFVSYFGLAILLILANSTFLKDVPLYWNLLILSEYLLAGPIVFETRAFLALRKLRKYIFFTIVQTTTRTLLLLLIIDQQIRTLAIVFYSIFTFLVWLRLHLMQLKFYKFEFRVLRYSIKKSLALGITGFLVTTIDSLPILYSGINLQNIDAGQIHIVLRIASVSAIPMNSLAAVTLAKNALTGERNYVRKHLIFSVFFSGFMIVFSGLILEYTDFLPSYPDVSHYLWASFLIVLFRSISIVYGNLLTLNKKNRYRFISLFISLVVMLLLFSGVSSQMLQGEIITILLISIVTEFIAVSLILFFGNRI